MDIVLLVNYPGLLLLARSGSAGRAAANFPGTQVLLFCTVSRTRTAPRRRDLSGFPPSEWLPGQRSLDHYVEFRGRIVPNYDGNWLPGGQVIGAATRFYEPTPETALTIPSTAQRVVAIGAYDSRTAVVCRILRTRIYQGDKPGETDACRAGRQYHGPAVGGISQRDRNFLCDAICHRGERPADGMGNRAEKMILSLQ